MRATILDGTPEEVAAALRLLAPAATSATGSPPLETRAVHATEAIGGTGYLSVEVARAVLSRLPLSQEQLTTLRAIYSAHPSMALATDLGRAINYTRSQFAGLLGAFGRRIGNTEGYIEGTSFFVQEWNHEAGCEQYSLPETAREAMRLEGLI